MHCTVAILPPRGGRRLLMRREDQDMLSKYLSRVLGYRPFVFNSSIGVFVFTQKKESFRRVFDAMQFFLSSDYLSQSMIVDVSEREGYFMRLTQNILHSERHSAYAWQRHISSFLLQLDPYQGENKRNTKVLKRFKNCVHTYGNSAQINYFKRKSLLLAKRFQK